MEYFPLFPGRALKSFPKKAVKKPTNRLAFFAQLNEKTADVQLYKSQRSFLSISIFWKNSLNTVASGYSIFQCKGKSLVETLHTGGYKRAVDGQRNVQQFSLCTLRNICSDIFYIFFQSKQQGKVPSGKIGVYGRVWHHGYEGILAVLCERGIIPR